MERDVLLHSSTNRLGERMEPQDRSNERSAGSRTDAAEMEFRQALLRSHRSPESLGEVEAAAAHFCRALRQQGVAPERMLTDAKRVIDDVIDGDDVPVAERAVQSCIRHYYRGD
jgi:hypothetical protein